MKRVGKILCGLLVLLLLAAIALAWWQRDNLKALYQAKTADAETILQESAAQLETHQKELEQYNVVIKTPTQEEKDELLSGGSVKTPESGKADAEKGNALQSSETDTAQEAVPEVPPAVEQPTAQSILDRCIQELYDCEIALMARLGTMKQAAIDEWEALPESQRTKTKKLEIGYRGLDACYKLEVEIDAQVQEILAKYRTELANINADTAPLDTLWKHYCEEKASTKAYYLNKYL